MVELKCRFGCDNPVAFYHFEKGCFCFPDRVQALCEHHVWKATPIGAMEFIATVPGVKLRGTGKMALSMVEEIEALLDEKDEMITTLEGFMEHHAKEAANAIDPLRLKAARDKLVIQKGRLVAILTKYPVVVAKMAPPRPQVTISEDQEVRSHPSQDVVRQILSQK